MATYTDAELESLMSDLESDFVERKESAADGRKIRRNICAFANDLPGDGRSGVVLIGVRDDGSCASLPIDDDLLTRLANVRGEGDILPLASMTVQKRVLKGCEVAVVFVEPSADTPVRYHGRVWVRVGPSVREGSVEDERLLGERRRAADLPFDSRPAAGIALEDLDLDFARDHYLSNAIAPDILERNAGSFEHQLRSLRLVQAGRPTWGAVLAFGRDPQAFVPGAYVQFLRIDGTAITDPIRHQKQLAGRLDDMVRRLDELIDLSVSVRTEVAGTPREKRWPDYPVDALRQLAHNAVMHRSYEGNEYTGTGSLVRRPDRDRQSRRAVRQNHPRELRHGRHRLSQSAVGRDHVQPRVRATLRSRGATCARCPGRERQPGTRVQVRTDPCRRHGEGRTVKSIAVFGSRGGVGTTSLVYHLAWMYANLDYNVVVADLDPQVDLTSMFLDDDALEELWAEDRSDGTIYASLRPLLDGTGDVTMPRVTEPAPGIGLVAGDILLSGAEDELSSQWSDGLDGKPRAFRVLSAIRRVLRRAADRVAADLVLVDVGPNLGALNRAVLVCADHVVVALAPDLHSIRGLRNLGPALRRWRWEWSERRERNAVADLDMPRGDMRPIGYVVLRHAVRLTRPFMAYERWMDRIPSAYGNFVAGESTGSSVATEADPHCLATLGHLRSLMPLAREARKPMFA